MWSTHYSILYIVIQSQSYHKWVVNIIPKIGQKLHQGHHGAKVGPGASEATAPKAHCAGPRKIPGDKKVKG
jgi:hypothetical protein